jgi:hypothetical protein
MSENSKKVKKLLKLDLYKFEYSEECSNFKKLLIFDALDYQMVAKCLIGKDDYYNKVLKINNDDSIESIHELKSEGSSLIFRTIDSSHGSSIDNVKVLEIYFNLRTNPFDFHELFDFLIQKMSPFLVLNVHENFGGLKNFILSKIKEKRYPK